MARKISSSFFYLDKGKPIYKYTWQDPETGETGDEFEDQSSIYGDFAGEDGTVFDPRPMFYPTEDPLDYTRGSRDAQTGYNETSYPINQSSAVQDPDFISTAARTPRIGTGGKTVPEQTMFNTQQTEMEASADAQKTGTKKPAGVSKEDKNVTRSRMLYDPENAMTAWRNILRESGINTLSMNPLAQMLGQAGAGLGQSFIMDKAQQKGQDPKKIGASYNEFADFLRNTLGGGGGGVYSTLASSMGKLPGAVGAVRGFAKDTDAGTTIDKLNPWAAMLSQSMGTPQGAQALIMSLLQPMMGRQMGQGYGRGLQASIGGNMRRVAESGDFSPGNDIWKYLLGE